jgi:hypothetical protein
MIPDLNTLKEVRRTLLNGKGSNRMVSLSMDDCYPSGVTHPQDELVKYAHANS